MEGLHILGQHQAVEPFLLQLLLQVVPDVAVVGDALGSVLAVGLTESIAVALQTLQLPQVLPDYMVV